MLPKHLLDSPNPHDMETELLEMEKVFVAYAPQLYFSSPFSRSGQLGAAYNDFLCLLPPGSWACLTDQDVMPLHPRFAYQCYDAITAHPEASFTCLTNRVASEWQLARDSNWWQDDIWEQTLLAAKIFSTPPLYPDHTHSSPLAGHMILLSKTTWEAVGGFKEEGVLGVDGDFHIRLRNAGLSLRLMDSTYIYHWYRGGDYYNVGHFDAEELRTRRPTSFSERKQQILPPHPLSKSNFPWELEGGGIIEDADREEPTPIAGQDTIMSEKGSDNCVTPGQVAAMWGGRVNNSFTEGAAFMQDLIDEEEPPK